IDLLVIALAASFVARATGVFVESAISRNTPALKSTRHVSGDTGTPATYYSKQVEDILKRNIFCSTCPPILPEPEKGDVGPAPDPEPTRTVLPLKLMAIMFSPPPNDPRWSMAVIRDTEQNSAGPYAIGMKVREAIVEDIQETRIFLNNAGKREYLDLIDKPQTEVAASPVAAVAPSTDPFVAEMEKGIKKLSEHQYEIQRGTVDSLLGNMAVLSRAARIVPEVRDGKAAGFRLFSVKADGPFGKIGLQNGDVISAINGLEMTSPDKALEIYTKLKSANHLAVALERNGQKITKDYNIR
ncbi:MAG: PDZ domain-containing protein, partial [Deltaproteobacteria bacterium]|nr:PDZ domain-containing protein [Deltaproteobacteria bacterium]